MHNIYKRELGKRYNRTKDKAKQAEENGQFEEAADLLEEAAKLAEDIADVESNETLANKRRDVASSHRESAAKFRKLAEQKREVTSGKENSDSDRTDRSDAGYSPDHENGHHQRDSSNSGDANNTVDGSKWLSPDPGIDFDDVGGMNALKQELWEKILEPLEYSELHEQYDLGAVNGVILHGPSGVGKSHIAKALVGELGSEWDYIGVRPSDVMGSLVGEPAQNLREMLATARENAPAIVFIDEIDGLFPPRSTGRSSDNQRQLINEMLIQMIELRDHDVVTIGATNVLDQIDDAVMGRHRFNKVIEVTRPDAAARGDILRIHLRDRPAATETIDFDVLRDKTGGFTAADIEEMADEAARMALQEAKEIGEIVPVTQSHLLEAYDEISESSPPE